MASFLEELKKSNPLQEGINKTGAGFQLPQIQPQVPQGQMQPQIQQVVPRVEAQAPEGKYGSMDLSSAANIDLGGGEFHSQFPATSPMLDPRRDTGSFAGTGSGIILDVPQNLPQNTSSGTGGFAGAEEVVSSITPKPSPAADSSGAFDPARVDDVDPFSANTGVDRLPQQYLGDADTTGGVQPQTPQAQAPTDGLTTQSGIPLSQFLSGEAIPEAGLRAEAPVFSSESRGISGVAGQDIMAQASAEREARAEAQFGQVRGPDSSDRERRMASGEGTSMADLTDMAKANARGASPRDVARGQKVADELGVDLKTGKPLETQGEGLTFDQVMKLQDFNFKRDQEAYKREQDTMVAEGKAAEAYDKDEALLRQVSGDAGRIGRLTNEAIGVTTETGTTGLAGSILKHVPGTDAHKLDSILEVVSSKVALDRLMEVKKTGATLGQVSEKELAMLQNSYDTLKQGLKGERLRKALVNYATQLKAVEDKTAKAFIGKHGQKKFDKIMGGGGSGGEPRYANDQNVGDSAESYYNPSK